MFMEVTRRSLSLVLNGDVISMLRIWALASEDHDIMTCD